MISEKFACASEGVSLSAAAALELGVPELRLDAAPLLPGFGGDPVGERRSGEGGVWGQTRGARKRPGFLAVSSQTRRGLFLEAA